MGVAQAAAPGVQVSVLTCHRAVLVGARRRELGSRCDRGGTCRVIWRREERNSDEFSSEDGGDFGVLHLATFVFSIAGRSGGARHVRVFGGSPCYRASSSTTTSSSRRSSRSSRARPPRLRPPPPCATGPSANPRSVLKP